MSIVPHASSAIAHGRGRLVLLGNSMGTPRIPARRGDRAVPRLHPAWRDRADRGGGAQWTV
ncbi:hypothetical protein [Nocardia fluminea]|uniref:hypothetical protein n=1 Tax=Nocardia fluminea TaxID=134984 RepID=UPI003D0D54BF